MDDRVWNSDKSDRYFPEMDDRSKKLFHIGTPQVIDFDPHGSGRYRQGSGKNPYQHSTDIRSFALEWRGKINPETGKKYTETELARAYGVSSTEWRRAMSQNKNEERAANISRALKYRESGMSATAIAEKMNEPVSTIKSWLLPQANANIKAKENLVNYLKDQVDEKTYLDIGKGVGAQLGVSDVSLKNAVYILQQEGYAVRQIKVPQATNIRQKTTIDVLVKDDVSWGEVWNNRDQIRSPHGVWFEDNGLTMKGIRDPVSVDSKRICVNYAENGGTKKDGVIEIRPGVMDLSLGSNTYAQVRIAVDDTHYLKGMAMYSNDIPKGYDIRFNTNKHEGIPMLGEKDNTVLKRLKDDPDNPFGSTIRQFDYVGSDGKMHQSPINIVNTDEDWDKWSKSLASQFLSKQPANLAKRQLDLVYQEKRDQLNDILNYPNNTIKAKLLQDLADECDSQAVNLKAAALPRQETKVILPLPSLKDTEVYAPTYANGEEVVLIRYPHAGQFEIPRLIVNNNNREGKEVIGNAQKAIGINSIVAEQLSGADFDGDTVVVIPTRGQNIRTMKPFKDLLEFNDKEVYKAYEGMPRVGKKKSEGGDGFDTQTEMGKVSNLITDMTIRDAPMEDIIKAVKHSMVVIDAEKHNLNWKQSEKDNDIKALKKKYQGGENKGAATVISRAKGRSKNFIARDSRYDINPDTGERNWRQAKDARYIDKKTGEIKYRQDHSTKMDETNDAFTLVSRDASGATTLIETIYATHANQMKALGNEARKALLNTPSDTMNRSARDAYSEEVASLEDKMRLALVNAPNERLAQAVASKKIQAVKNDNPGMSEDDEMKLRNQIINGARKKAGAAPRSERVIKTTDKEWEAIVAGALSKEKTMKILGFMDTDEILSRTIPRETLTISDAKLTRAKALLNAGYTWNDVAETLGVNVSTLRSSINKEKE